MVPNGESVRQSNHNKKNLAPRRADYTKVEAKAGKPANTEAANYLILPSTILLQFQLTRGVLRIHVEHLCVQNSIGAALLQIRRQGVKGFTV